MAAMGRRLGAWKGGDGRGSRAGSASLERRLTRVRTATGRRRASGAASGGQQARGGGAAFAGEAAGAPLEQLQSPQMRGGGEGPPGVCGRAPMAETRVCRAHGAGGVAAKEWRHSSGAPAAPFPTGARDGGRVPASPPPHRGRARGGRPPRGRPRASAHSPPAPARRNAAPILRRPGPVSCDYDALPCGLARRGARRRRVRRRRCRVARGPCRGHAAVQAPGQGAQEACQSREGAA